MCAQKIVKPSAESLATAARAAGARGLPPVERWDPPFCGDLDIRIARDGTWFYLGTPIGRPALVRLFSSILRRDGDEYFLVTPVEKVRIRVDAAPFIAIDVQVDGSGPTQTLTFTTQVGDTVTPGPENPVRVDRDPETDEPSPHVLIRRNLWALIDRKTFYRLVDIGETGDVDGTAWFGLWSGGQFFPVIPAAELP